MVRHGSFVLEVLIFLLLTLSFVSAIGISPSKIELAFEPNAHEEIIINLINSAGRPLNATLQLGGDLAQYMKSEEGFFVIPPYQSKAYTITIDFPAVIRKPGEHIVSVNAVQAPINTGKEAQGIGAVISVEGKIVIRVPYTGKYAETTLELQDINEGEQSKATFSTINYGLEDIQRAVGTLQIYDATGALLDSLSTPQVYIPAQTTETALIVLDSSKYGAGIFPIIAFTEYDGDTTEQITEELRIGTLFVNVTDYTKKVYTKSLVPFQIQVHNRWNNQIEHLSAEIRFFKQGTQIGDVLITPSIALPAWEQLPLSALWDTRLVETGLYDAQITLHYYDKTTLVTVPVLVESKFNLSTTLILTIIIIGMLLIDVIVWLVHHFKNHEKED
ncbi:MAG: hypothetical protein Q8L34_06250 [Candidatus Woesearchaeota archaeon]|nr:hypothetical protein [Candidatus Woesearchaeota archaeon]